MLPNEIFSDLADKKPQLSQVKIATYRSAPIMKTPPTELCYVPELPSTLSDLLEAILLPSDTSEEHRAFYAAVLAAKVANDEGRADSDATIKVRVGMFHEPKQEAYFDAYVQYLGMTLHFYEQHNSDAAWYYYAQSRYYKGLFDSFEAVLNQVEADFQKINARGRGGKKKAANQTGEMKDEFLKIITNPPEGRWTSLKQLVELADEALGKFHIATKQTLPLYWNIRSNIELWLREDPRISKAYVENSADPEQAIEEIFKKKSNDPNIHF